MAGCIAIPIEKDISIYKLQDIMKTTKPSLVFIKNNGENYEDYFHPDISERKIAFPKKDDDAAIISTTGTTGSPVLVSHTNRGMLSVTQNLVSGINLTEQTVLFTNIPFNLAAGYRRVLAALYCGATAIITNEPITLDSLRSYTQMYHITFLSLVSPTLAVLIDEMNSASRDIFSDITHVESATGFLSYDVIMKFHNYFPHITLYNVYGTTESGCVLINNTAENYNEGCIGKATCNAEVFLVDENNERITTPGKFGHIAVKGDMNMKGYYKKKGLTDKVLQNNILILNDIAYFDEEGYFYFVSRVGDIINVNGHKIIPTEVEQIAMQFQGVRDCVCVAKEDPHSGQIPILYVVCKDRENFDFDKMKDFLKTNLEPYRVPESIIRVQK